MVAPGKINLLAIVGPTASGKSALAMQVAEAFGGEIIAADSRTIYKGMDIGTAKPTTEDRHKVQHWGLDLVRPGQAYSAARFKKYAQSAVEDMQNRGKLSILAGGSGLYINSLLYDFSFGAEADEVKRQELEKLSTHQLQQLIIKNGYAMPQNSNNRRHLIRTLERQGHPGSRRKLIPNSLITGLALPDEKLRQDIEVRAAEIIHGGVLQETKELINKYGRGAVLKNGPVVYKICIRLLDGKINEQTATTELTKSDWQYARRQRTWFRRNPDIAWFQSPEKAFLYLKKVLNTNNT